MSTNRILLRGVLFCILALCSLPGMAQTEISGKIPSELTADKSPYNVVGDIVLEEGSLTHIEAGVTLVFMGRYGIKGGGDLYAYGTKEDRITFTAMSGAETPGTWSGIFVDKCELSYCDIQYADTAIKASNLTAYHSSIVNNQSFGILLTGRPTLQIVNSELRGNGGYAVYCSGAPTGLLTVSKNVISDNGGGLFLTTVGYSPYEWVVGSGHKATLTYTITDNEITNNNGNGIYISASGSITVGSQSAYVSEITVNSLINNNLLYENQGGIRTAFPDVETLIEISSLSLTADQNTLWKNGETAVHVDNNVLFGMSNSSIYGAGESNRIELDPSSNSAFQYCNLPTLLEGTGNLSTDPLYEDAEGGNFKPEAGSPLVDAGDVDRKDPDGSRLDIGHGSLHIRPYRPEILGYLEQEFEYLQERLPSPYMMQWIDQGDSISYFIEVTKRFDEAVIFDTLTEQSHCLFNDLPIDQFLDIKIRALNTVGDTSSLARHKVKFHEEYLENIYSRSLFQDKVVRDIPFMDENYLVAIVSSPESIESEKWSIAVLNNDSLYSDRGLIACPETWKRFDGFGHDMHMHGDLLITSSPGDDSISENSGKVFLYEYVDQEWKMAEVMKAQNVGAGDRFGKMVRLDSSTACVVADGEWTVQLHLYHIDQNRLKLDTTFSILKNDYERLTAEKLEILDNRIFLGLKAYINGKSQVEIRIFEKEDSWVHDTTLINDEVYLQDMFVDSTQIILGHSSYDGKMFHYGYEGGKYELMPDIETTNLFADQFLGGSISVDDDLLVASSNMGIFLFNSVDRNWQHVYRFWRGGVQSVYILDGMAFFVTKPLGSLGVLPAYIYKLRLEDYISPEIVMSYPGNDDVIAVHKPKLYWNEPFDQTESILQVSESDDFSECFIHDTIGGVTSELPILKSGDTYYWRLKSRHSEWSDPYSFRIEQAGADTILPFRAELEEDGFGKSLIVVDSFLFVGAPDQAGGGLVYVYKRMGNPAVWEPFQLISSPEADYIPDFGTRLIRHLNNVFIGAYNRSSNDDIGIIFEYVLEEDHWKYNALINPMEHDPDYYAVFDFRIAADSSVLTALIYKLKDGMDAILTYRKQEEGWDFESVTMLPDSLELNKYLDPKLTLEDGYLYVSGLEHREIYSDKYILSFSYSDGQWGEVNSKKYTGGNICFGTGEFMWSDDGYLTQYHFQDGEFSSAHNQRFETVNYIYISDDYLYTKKDQDTWFIYKRSGGKYYFLTVIELEGYMSESNDRFPYTVFHLDDSDLYMGFGSLDLPGYWKADRDKSGMVFFLEALDEIEFDTTGSDPALHIFESSEVGNDVHIYPNPVTDDHLTFEFRMPMSGRLDVFDIHGRLVVHEEIHTLPRINISIRKLRPGLYLYRVGNREKIYTGRFVVNNQ